MISWQCALIFGGFKPRVTSQVFKRIYDVWHAPEGGGAPDTVEISRAGSLPAMFQGTSFSWILGLNYSDSPSARTFEGICCGCG